MTYDPHPSSGYEVVAEEISGHAGSAATTPLDPEVISNRRFTESRQGYETSEVDSYLVDLAAWVQGALSREHELELRIADLERQLDDATERARSAEEVADLQRADLRHEHRAVTSLEDLDEGQLAELVGEETAKVLSAARNAAAGIVANAERTAAQMRAKADRDAERLAAEAEARLERSAREADAEAARRLNEADTAIGLATAEANQRADLLRAAAESGAAEIEDSARRRLDEAQDEASSIIDLAKREARGVVEQAALDSQGLVADAHQVRATMLEELLRRRKLLRRQVEQLHAGRQRLAVTFDVVHDSMAVIDNELGAVLREARDAAEEAADRSEQVSDPATIALEDMARASRSAAAPVTDAPPPAADAGDRDAGDRDAGLKDAGGNDAGVPDPDEDRARETEASDPEARDLEARDPEARDLEARDLEARDPEARDPEARDPEARDLEARDLEARDPEARDPRDCGGGGEIQAGDSGSGEAADDAAAFLFSRLKADPVIDPDLPFPPTGEVRIIEKIPVDPQAGPPDAGPQADHVTALSEDQRDLRDKLLDDLQKAAVRRMKRRLTEEQNELLDTIRRERPLPELDAFLAPEAEHERRYAEVALPALRNAADSGRELSDALAAGDRQAAGGPARDVVNVVDVAAVLAVDVVGTLRARLETCMAGDDAALLRATPKGSPGATANRTKVTAASDSLCDGVRLAYRDVRNRTVDTAVRTAVVETFARGLGLPEGLDTRLAPLLEGLI